MKKPIFAGTVAYLGFTIPNTSEIVSSGSLVMHTGKGVQGDKHYGETRLLDARETKLKSLGFAKYLTIANMRQITLMSAFDWLSILNKAQIGSSEIDIIEFSLKKDDSLIYTPQIFYGASNENIVLIPDEGYEEVPFSQLPSQSFIIFRKADKDDLRSVILQITEENKPCFYPETEIKKRIQSNNLYVKDFSFSKVAHGGRGLCAIVYSGGDIKIGDRIEIY